MKYTDLNYGEIYEITKTWTYSDFEDSGIHVKVPKGARLILRSIWPSKTEKGSDVVVFYWLNERKSVCLVASTKKSVVYMKHIPWEKRNIENEEA